MLSRILCFFALLAVLIGSSAQACSYPAPPEFRHVVERATAIFVMRVLDSRLMPSRESTRREWVEADIEVVEELLGHVSDFKRLEFDNLPCGGVRMDVGHYYLVYTDQVGDTLRLVPADPSVLNITAEYSRWFPEQNHKFPALAATMAFIRGEHGAESIDPYPYLELTGVAMRIDCNLCPR